MSDSFYFSCFVFGQSDQKWKNQLSYLIIFCIKNPHFARKWQPIFLGFFGQTDEKLKNEKWNEHDKKWLNFLTIDTVTEGIVGCIFAVTRHFSVFLVWIFFFFFSDTRRSFVGARRTLIGLAWICPPEKKENLYQNQISYCIFWKKYKSFRFMVLPNF